MYAGANMGHPLSVVVYSSFHADFKSPATFLPHGKDRRGSGTQQFAFLGLSGATSYYLPDCCFKKLTTSRRSCAFGTWKSMLLPGIKASVSVSHCSSDDASHTTAALMIASE
jgi:hypothetical protein